MRIVIKNELLWMLIFSLLVFFINAFSSLTVLKVFLVLPCVLIFPGYVLLAALYPSSNDLGNLERLVLSFGFSILLVPFLGVTLINLPWGIGLYPIIIAMTIYYLAVSWFAWYQRSKLPEEQRLLLCIELNSNWLNVTKAEKAAKIALLISILIALGTLGYIVTEARPYEGFTEFFILGEDGIAGNYPHELKITQDVQVKVAIFNHEGQKNNYRLEVDFDGQLVQEFSPLTLENGDRWEEVVFLRYPCQLHTIERGDTLWKLASTNKTTVEALLRYNPGIQPTRLQIGQVLYITEPPLAEFKPSREVKINFRLFREDTPNLSPYRSLHLWMVVSNK